MVGLEILLSKHFPTRAVPIVNTWIKYSTYTSKKFYIIKPRKWGNIKLAIIVDPFQGDQIGRFFPQLGYFWRFIVILWKDEVAQSKGNFLGYILFKKILLHFPLNWHIQNMVCCRNFMVSKVVLCRYFRLSIWTLLFQRLFWLLFEKLGHPDPFFRSDWIDEQKKSYIWVHLIGIDQCPFDTVAIQW